MDKPSLERVEQLFHQAADMAPGERAVFLQTECAGDETLRAAVEELLRHDVHEDKTESLMVSPIERTLRADMPTASPGEFGNALGLMRHALEGYELLEVLGSGGMGVVFKARQLRLGRVVAVKMMLSAAAVSADQLARFRTEAETLAQLQHPNIVQIYEVDEHEGRPYIVMEYVPGPNLAQALAGHPQPDHAAAELMEKLAGAMQAVHKRGIVHRDLKPANILLQQEEGERMKDEGDPHRPEIILHPSSFILPKITDFGIAKRLDRGSNATKTGAVLGTPSYMAPEQAGGHAGALGPAADIYALGAILYEMLTGRPPFDGATTAETLAQVLTDEPISPARLRPALPRDLVTICLKCLEKEPARRYASAEALGEDLRLFLAAKPIHARHIGPVERLWRWCRRRPLVAGLTAATGFLAAALVITIIVYQSLLHAAMAQQLAQTAHKLEDTEQTADEERRQLSKLHTSHGVRDIEEGDIFAALLRLTEALRLDGADSAQANKHRLWIALILQQCPQLARFAPGIGPIAGVQVSPAGCWIATIGKDRTLVVWNVMTGSREILYGAIQPGEESLPVTISPDGLFVAVESADGSMRIWDLHTGKPRSAPLGRGAMVVHAFFADDDRVLLGYLADGTVQAWDTATGRSLTLEGATEAAPRQTASSNDGHWLFTLSAAGVGKLGQFSRGKYVQASLHLSHTPILAAVPADGRHLAFLDRAKELWIWDADSDKERLLIPSVDSEGPVRQMQWSPDGRLVLTMGDRLRVWDAVAGTPATLAMANGGQPRAAGFAGNDTVVGVDHAGNVRVWNLTQLRAPAVTQEPPLIPISQTPTSPGQKPVLLANGKTVRVKTPATAAALRAPQAHERILEHAAFSPQGEWLATAGEQHEVLLWDTALGSQHGPPLRHKGNVVHAAFSRDGRRLATAGEDKTVTIWDTATGEPVTFPLPSLRDIERVVFDADGQQIISVCKGGHMKAWRLEPETRPLEELVALAQVLSGRSVREDGALVPLDTERLQAAWVKLGR